MATQSHSVQQSTAGSTTSAAVPVEAASDTTSILLERLVAWKGACSHLENYIISTDKLHKDQAKDYSKTLKEISHPLKEGHHFDAQLGGVNGMFENIKGNTQAMSNLYAETQKNLQTQVLPILERLHAEIKGKEKEMDKGAAKGTKVVDKSRAQTQKEIEKLGQTAASYKTVGGKPNAESDPYVIHRGVVNRLHRQLEEENATRGDVIMVQESFEKFEIHVVQTFGRALTELARIMGGENQRSTALYENMAQNAAKMQGDFEWKGFVSRNSQYLVDPHAAPRSIDQVQFANMNHESTKPILAGVLEKKGKLLNKFESVYCVLTPAKYLHEYKDQSAAGKDPSPEASLYLPDCSVGTPDGTKFTIKGKDTSHSTIVNKLARASETVLQAQSVADAQLWYRTLVETTGQVEGVSSSPTSPIGGNTTGAGVGSGGMATQPAEPGVGSSHAASTTTGGPPASGQQTTLPHHTQNQGPVV